MTGDWGKHSWTLVTDQWTLAHTTKFHLTAWLQEAEGALFLLSLLVKNLYTVNICKPLARTNSTCSKQQKQGLLQPWEFLPVKSLRGRRDRISGTSWSITKLGQVHKHPDKAVAGDKAFPTRLSSEGEISVLRVRKLLLLSRNCFWWNLNYDLSYNQHTDITWQTIIPLKTFIYLNAV